MYDDTLATPYLPALNEIREDLAKRFCQITCPEPLLTIRLGTRPRSLAGEEMFLQSASLRPSDSVLEVLGCRLPDREPSVGKRFCVISDESQPVLFLANGDPIWLREDTCKRSVHALNEGINECTNYSLSLRIILFRNVVGPLILKIRCTDVRRRKKNSSCGAYFRK